MAAERASLDLLVDDRLPHRPAMVTGDPQRLQQAFARLLADSRHANAPTDPGDADAGLGVVAARLLLEPMRGSVSVDREPGRGERFTVRLPRA